ncbi:ARM repeat-containing protein [Gonapodya prolifera JEL478]|uniref:ARM repeat-containing protein n=1 Tax=Gonapodya prolifera (strain JEL478) TaxID=1344416 RepID=A0A138ZWX5_GONPJ|nr:ARM repeat-containing protein [Gonapodya prolifera JEL478]|eukprot:KXS09012.1 ARM repeat-containing protein [Gonapodya prolifera JEL478]
MTDTASDLTSLPPLPSSNPPDEPAGDPRAAGDGGGAEGAHKDKTLRAETGPKLEIDPARQEVAYGRRAVPKGECTAKHAKRTTSAEEGAYAAKRGRGFENPRISTLSDPSPAASLSALTILSTLLHHPAHLSSALCASLLPSLAPLLASPDPATRLLAARACVTVCGQAVGRAAVAEGAVGGLKKLAVEDEDGSVREAAYEAVRRVSGEKHGVESLLRHAMLRPLVSRLRTETLAVQHLALHTLYNILRTGVPPKRAPTNPGSALSPTSASPQTLTAPADTTDTSSPDQLVPATSTSDPAPTSAFPPAPTLRPDVIPDDALDPAVGLVATLRDLARQGMPEVVKVWSCRCIMMLSFFPDGKRLAVKENLLKPLIALLRDRRSEVRAAAAGSIMSITVDVEAKKQMVRENALPLLVDLLSGADRNEEALLNACRCIANCAEDYRGRFQLSSCLKKLEELKGHPNTQLGDAAKRAIEVITWRP